MRTRRSTVAASTAEQEEPVSTGRLQFDQPLSWRAGKSIAVGELLQRLRALVKEMCGFSQEEEIDEGSFRKISQELTHHNLIAHKDKGIRAWTACALVEILRICAPNAPFTTTQLKDIFTLVINSILPAISDPSNAYNGEHLHVLASLAEFKSICLIADIPSSDTLILRLFTTLFDLVSGSSQALNGESLPKNVEYHVSTIMVTLVDESNSLPSEVVDVILAQFLRVDPRILQSSSSRAKRNGTDVDGDGKQTTLLLKELPPAYSLAQGICLQSQDKMARYVSQYFNDVVMDASATIDSSGGRENHRRGSLIDDSDSEGPNPRGEDDLKDLRKAHQLMKEIWRACPEVLMNVIPQLETELSADNVPIRILATETLGDIAAGIGAAGLPPTPLMDPTLYPPATLATYKDQFSEPNVLTIPCSQMSFSQTHPAAYNTFLEHGRDRSALVRAVWATAVGRILVTASGGRGLNRRDEKILLDDLKRTLGDSDERVRLSAIKAISRFGFTDVLNLAQNGGVDEKTSVLHVLADRVKDRKHNVREDAMKVLARMWGVAAGEIQAGNKEVRSALDGIPSRILDAYYTNNSDILVLMDHVIYEILLPLSYPPVKLKHHINSGNKNKEGNEAESTQEDLDMIRVQRILTLIRGLDEKAKIVFYGMQRRQVQMSKVLAGFLQRCEVYNGGIVEEKEDEKAVKKHLGMFIDSLSSMLPDAPTASADLWKFAKKNDRRSYQLIRFCMAPESDFRTVYKAIKELGKRIQEDKQLSGILSTITPLLYRSSLIIFNKSHVPAIMKLSRTNEYGLSGAAHELLKEISVHKPGILKTHIKELCKAVEEQGIDDVSLLDTLKACSGFAKKFPDEIPNDEKFTQCLVNYAARRSPDIAKHAVSIVMTITDNKDVQARELMQIGLKGFEFGSDLFLTKLALLSQLVLFAREESDKHGEELVEVATTKLLQQNRSPSPNSEYVWTETVDDECAAKIWALRLLVNRIQSGFDPKNYDPDDLKKIAQPVYKLLISLVQGEGEISKNNDTPANHKPRLRLQAALLLLKLSTRKAFDEFLSPAYFNILAVVAQDQVYEVRLGFIEKLEKYLSQSRISPRFYSIPFLLAFEPKSGFKETSTTWIKSRATVLANKHSTILETTFPRFLSLLAHHPDYGNTLGDLSDIARYIMFYLQGVANEENIGLIYHGAQRVKQASDAIDPQKSENLYTLSDLAQMVIYSFSDARNWNMQTWPGKMLLPGSLFSTLPTHEAAQEIAMKTYLPEDMDQNVDHVVRIMIKERQRHAHSNKKRKSEVGMDEEHAGPVKKKTKSSRSRSLGIRRKSTSISRTPRRPTRIENEIPSSEIRRSGRTKAKAHMYTERDDSEDDEEFQEWNSDEEDDVKGADSVDEVKTPMRSQKPRNGDQAPSEEGNDGNNEQLNDSSENEDDD